MPVEQVVQIHAATNGFVDRINVDKVTRFLDQPVRVDPANEPERPKKIAGGDWSDETQYRSCSTSATTRRAWRSRTATSRPRAASRPTRTRVRMTQAPVTPGP